MQYPCIPFSNGFEGCRILSWENAPDSVKSMGEKSITWRLKLEKMPPTIYTCTWIWSDSDANLHFNFSWPCSSNSKPPYIPLRPVHPRIVKEVLQDIAYACRIMLHQHKAAQLKRVASATKNYVQLHGPWLSFQARHASNCISVFPHIGLIGIYDWMMCRQRLPTLEIQERGNEFATFKGQGHQHCRSH